MVLIAVSLALTARRFGPILRKIMSPSKFSPAQQLSLMDAAQWEAFILEWIDGFDPPYVHTQRLGGAGDMGRDVVAYLGQPNTDCEWDNYQCKHYATKLSPADIWVELGKLCYYTFRGEYTVPRRYRFVAPKDVTTTLFDLLRKPNKIREGLISNWPAHCERKITQSLSIPCTGGLRSYIDAFDFGIVGYETVTMIVQQHSRTPHHRRRFDLQNPVRPSTPTLPAEVDENIEQIYIQQLLDAYADHLGVPITSIAHPAMTDRLRRHFARAREYFYEAEALNRFSRDQIEAGAFELLKRQIYHGIIEIHEEACADGFERIRKTTEEAKGLPLTGTPLIEYLTIPDKIGVCHHLANDGTITWVAGHEKK